MKRNPKPHGYFMHEGSTGFKFKATASQKRTGNTLLGIMKLVMLAALSLFVSFMVASMLGINPIVVALAMFALGLIPQKKEKGVAMMAVNLNQLLVAELLQIFSNIKDDFLADIKDYSGAVNNDVIKFNDIGADPDVLIDPAYPIANVARADAGIPVSLFLLATKNTVITAAEYQALPYDKNSSVMAAHVRALKDTRVKLGLHSLAPVDDTVAAMPVFETTGAVTGGRRALTIADLINYKKILDNLEVPAEGRKLVLCSDHISDLLMIDNVFRDRYYNIATGKMITMLLGFEVYENTRTPKYFTDLTKIAYGAAPAGTDRNASVFFSTANAMKAIGSADVFYRDKSMDPENRATVIGMSMYYIVSPVTNRGYGAIVAGL